MSDTNKNSSFTKAFFVAGNGVSYESVLCTYVYVKGKAFPLQPWTGPWGSRRFTLQNV
jgi:hypothetical protein